MSGRLRERRAGPRQPPEATPWHTRGILRPGHGVWIVDVGAGGVRVRAGARLLPGTPAQVQLQGACGRVVVRGRVMWSRVCALRPLVYEGAIAFDQPLAWPVPAGANAG